MNLDLTTINTPKQLWNDAMLTQNAPNFSGILLSFGRAYAELARLNPNVPLFQLGDHPVLRALWMRLMDFGAPGRYEQAEWKTTMAIVEENSDYTWQDAYVVAKPKIEEA